MTEHIGIVACSAPGAALCYETICTEGSRRLGGYHHPEVTLNAPDFAEHVRRVEAGDWDGVGDILLESAGKVAAAGATFAICPDNTAHIALERVREDSPIPWLHIADAVADEAKRRGYRRLGLLGTRYLVESDVYPVKLADAALEWRLPPQVDRQRVNGIIFDDLVFARVTDAAREQLAQVVRDFASRQECDAVVLGCTEIPLALTPESSVLPALDSTRLLARAAIARAAGT